jgi:hypothetical protein
VAFKWLCEIMVELFWVPAHSPAARMREGRCASEGGSCGIKILRPGACSSSLSCIQGAVQDGAMKAEFAVAGHTYRCRQK